MKITIDDNGDDVHIEARAGGFLPASLFHAERPSAALLARSWYLCLFDRARSTRCSMAAGWGQENN